MVKCRDSLKQLFRNSLPKSNYNGYLNLNMNENVSGLPKEFLDKVMLKVTPKFLASYPNYYNLQKLIAKHNNLEFENICITNGSDAAIHHIFNTYINSRDKVLYCLPIFAMYPIYSDIFGAEKVEINYSNFSFPFEKFKEKIEEEEIKVAVIVNPCNPVGSLLEENKIISLIETARKNNTLVVVDEAYFYFSNETMVEYIKKYDNLIVLRTFSKLCGMASARVGYICACEKIINDVYKVKQTFDANGIGVLIASNMLEDKTIIPYMINEFNEGKKYLINKLKENNFEFYEGNANFILVKLNDKVSEVVKKLEKNKVLINGNYEHPLLKNYIRITVSNKNVMEKFWNVFIKICELPN
ncbi:aminotransferase class I/II-fold pyridoxal phosphate-dependent enzyme [Clostridium cagae]|uniref:aminotransferase class I/II-fold pyridoxal phosphate-dependent enzyme n=1 Tax=Clostridium cagae TaxID=2080751 RepID=UPI003F768930